MLSAEHRLSGFTRTRRRLCLAGLVLSASAVFLRPIPLLSQTSDPQTILWDLFMNTLSRQPTNQELALYTPMFQQLGNQAAAENVQWVLLNKVDFLFNY